MSLPVSFVMLALLLATTLAGSDEYPVAFVETIHGTVMLSGSNRPLDASADRGLILKAGDRLDCIKGDVLGVMPTKGTAPINLCSNPWRSDHLASNTDGDLSAEATKKLSEYVRAGRSKGDANPIYNPPDHGAVLTDNFVVRWRNRPPLDRFTAVLQDGSTELARVPDVDGTQGLLNSAIFQRALTSLRNSSVPNHELQVVFRFENGSRQLTSFAVLTGEEEHRLHQELAGVSQSGLFKFVQRAAIYDSFRLYGLVASEYDDAVADAPESRDLLRAAMQAYARIGDFHRARELRDRLREVEESSGNYSHS